METSWRLRAHAFLSRNSGLVLAVFAAACVVLLNLGYCLARVPAKTVAILGTLSCLVIIGVAVASHLMRKRGSFSPTYVFALFLVAQGLFYLFVFTPFTVPDEFYHYECAYHYSDIMLLLGPTADNLPMRAEDALLVSGTGPELSGLGYGLLRDGFQWVGDASLVSVEPLSAFDMGANPPQLKLPAALGITIGRLIGLGTYPVFYLGRIFNFAFFVALACAAFRVIPLGRRALMAACFLPMTLHVVTSYSYDAGILGLSFLLTALCLKGVRESGPIGWPLLSGIAVVTALLAPCKVIYALIIVLVFFIPASRFSSKKRAILFKAGVVGIALLAVAATRFVSLLDLAGVEASAEEFVRGTEVGTLYTASDALSDPLAFLKIMMMTLDAYGSNYLITALGGSLGWFQPSIAAPTVLVVAFLVLVLLSIPRAEGEPEAAPLCRRALLFAVVVVVWLLVMVSMYLAHTFNTEEYIQGVQGRYILPVLPLLLLSFRGRTCTMRRDLLVPLAVGFALLNSVYLTRVYTLALLT